MRYLPVLLLISLLSACSSAPNSGRYSQRYDSAPTSVPDLDHIGNAVPRDEPLSRGGNKSSYTVLGKTYKVYKNIDSFSEDGYASWYGNKFHGHKTSNGEIYDMYKMTAAHKNLPLPSYVRVTNKNNDRSVIVRVNDRGPFHQGRVIDLSYVAAYKLGMLKRGTAPVRVELIKANQQIASSTSTPINNTPHAITGSEQTGFFVQVMALSNSERATQIARSLSQRYACSSNIQHPIDSNIYRVQLGPFSSRTQAQQIQRRVSVSHDSSAFVMPDK